MNLRCTMSFEYGSEKEAKAVADALEPDNEGFVRTKIEGAVLSAVASADSVESLRHTLDDFLACVRVAEEAVGVERVSSSQD
jgi:hypothetical protein